MVTKMITVISDIAVLLKCAEMLKKYWYTNWNNLTKLYTENYK